MRGISEPLRRRLELCRRLGIRYVSTLSGGKAGEEPGAAAATRPPAPAAATAPGQAVPAPDPAGETPSWLTDSPDSIPAMELTAFDRDIRECQKCPLGGTRRNFVFGSGNPRARVVFVGEAPGAEEDAQGLPFVGAAGQLLTRIIESTRTWKRRDVFICNILKCRPPGNRTPLPEEVEQCLPYLQEQVRIIRPRLLMAMGATAAQALLGTRDSVGKLRNRWHDFGGIPLRVTYHPAALLRFEGYKKDVWEDMKELTKKYTELEGA